MVWFSNSCARGGIVSSRRYYSCARREEDRHTPFVWRQSFAATRVSRLPISCRGRPLQHGLRNEQRVLGRYLPRTHSADARLRSRQHYRIRREIEYFILSVTAYDCP